MKRIKRVFGDWELPRIWAKQDPVFKEGWTKHKNLSFEGPFIWSYKTQMAGFYQIGKVKFVAVNAANYGPTTGRHQRNIYSAILLFQKELFRIHFSEENPSRWGSKGAHTATQVVEMSVLHNLREAAEFVHRSNFIRDQSGNRMEYLIKKKNEHLELARFSANLDPRVKKEWPERMMRTYFLDHIKALGTQHRRRNELKRVRDASSIVAELCRGKNIGEHLLSLRSNAFRI